METLEEIKADLHRSKAEWLQKKSATDNVNVKFILVEETDQTVEYSTGSKETLNVRLARSDETLGDNSSETSNVTLPIKNSKENKNMQMYEQLIFIFNFFGMFCGMRVRYDWNALKSPVFWFVIAVLNFSLFCICYSARVHYNNGEYIRILEPFAISGVTASGFLKLHGYMIHHENMFAMLFTMRMLIQQNVYGPIADMIEAGLLRMIYLIKIYLSGIVLAVSIFILVPAYLTLVKHQWVTLTPYEIIFCDTSTLSGFIAANVVQAVLGFYAGVATAFYGVVFVVIIVYYTFKSKMLGEDFKQLDKMWNSKSKIHISIKHQFLINICKKRQDMNKYLELLKEIFETKLLAYICCSYFSQIICLYEITNGWTAAYSLAFGMFIEMMFYCIMGTLLTITHDELQYIIYQTNWYEYDQQSQKTILLLLLDGQSLTELQLGSIGPLNLVTFVTIVKSIYSYYTVLTELF